MNALSFRVGKTPFSIILLFLLLFVNTSKASNVAGVFGPSVDVGDRTFEYRAGFDPDTDDLVQRVHYQHSLSGDLRLRGVFQGRKTEQSDLDFDFFQGEVQWQLEDRSPNWQQAIRVDARIADRGRRGLAAVTWTNNLKWTDTLSSTALVLASIDIGNNSRTGLFLQTRANLTKQLNGDLKLGAEWFSEYGSTSDFKSFDEQIHQVGPSISGKLAGWNVYSGVLLGVTDASPDQSLRFWLSKGF